jgi:hypothetical protein
MCNELEVATSKIFEISVLSPFLIENPYAGTGRKRHWEVRQRLALKVVEIKLGLTTTLFKEGDRW